LKAEGGRCPGESKCGDFQRAAGETREQKAHVCIACPLLSTKPTPGSKQDEEFLDHIYRLVRERNSGFGRAKSELTNLEFEAVIYWDACVALHEQRQKSQMKEMFEFLTARLAAQA
jgi:hypothetical protein